MNVSVKISLILMILTQTESFAQKDDICEFKWNQLPPVPDAIGYAGSFAGVSNGALLVAGGANFPDGGAPWTGSTKKWHDKIFVLETATGQWKEAGKLPRPLGYGVSVSWKNTLICLGGSNESGHFSDVFLLKYADGKVHIESLPSMPKAIANTCGAVIGDLLYVAGGTETPDAQSTENIFWSLDLSKPETERVWKQLPSWPGASRMLSVAGAGKNAFYLFSGARLREGKREYLKDAYKFTPSEGWSRIADLPAPVVAAPATAYVDNSGNLLIFGGDDGLHAPVASSLRENHPGFSTKILAYNVSADTWSVAGNIATDKKQNAASSPNESTWAPVTTSLVVWNGEVILPGGEVRPAVRTPRVLRAIPCTKNR